MLNGPPRGEIGFQLRNYCALCVFFVKASSQWSLESEEVYVYNNLWPLSAASCGEAEMGEMGEICGVLKVRVVKGRSLAVRDIRSSDPYVVLKLGNQVVKTKVISSNLNPVWDEELSLNISSTTPRCLKVEVFDKDTFTADDEMGDAEIDLQPLAASVRMRKVLKGTPSSTQIRKLVPSKDNYLARESCIRYVDGNMIQELCLRLRNVETGELEMHLKWIDPPAKLDGKQ